MIPNLDLQKVSHWFMVNRINLNLTKSNYLIIPPKLKETLPQISFTSNNIPKSTSKTVKYLGVHPDSQLNFQNHVTETENELSPAVGNMSKLKHFPPKSALNKLYYAVVYLHLLYSLIT